jgi:hypothetical protein
MQLADRRRRVPVGESSGSMICARPMYFSGLSLSAKIGLQSRRVGRIHLGCDSSRERAPSSGDDTPSPRLVHRMPPLLF